MDFKRKIINFTIRKGVFRCLEIAWQRTLFFKHKKNYSLVKIFIPLFLFFYLFQEFLNKSQLRYSGLDVPITAKCNLYCDYCANLMKYYKGKKNLHLSLNELIEEMELLFDTVDYIYNLKILGGEPFLNKDLGAFVEYLLSNDNFSDKFYRIVILTNGTIFPDEKCLEVFQNDKVLVGISNYGKKSERIISILEENKINYELSTGDEEWFDMGDMNARGRSENVLEKIFNICQPKFSCNSYFKCQFHLCPRSSHGVDLGLVPNNDNDYVLFDKNDSIESRRKKLFALRDLNYIAACDYCDWPLRKVINKRKEV